MILHSKDFTDELLKSISGAKTSAFLLSAFVKKEALKVFSEIISDKKIEVYVVARWQLADLVSGASDFNVYEFCRDRGWKFGVDFLFHGKLYLIDEKDIFLGSANLTQRGLMLAGFGNHELGIKVKAVDTDIKKLSSFVAREVTWLDDELYAKLKAEVDASINSEKPLTEYLWSEDIKNIFGKSIEFLWVYELSFKKPKELLCLDLNDENSAHDFELFNLNIDDFDEASLRQGFKKTRLFSWVTAQLKENGSMNFGAFSQALHNALLDDPAPYRTRVKEFVAILFAWFEFLDDDFELTKYNVTTSVRLRE